jgi:trimethylamine--corrinoid protein Co-methyltransferase
MTEELSPATRRGGRGERRAIRTRPNHDMLPYLTGRLPLTAPMDEDQIARIDDASLSILEEVGVVLRDDIALEDWRNAGADVRGETVHLDRALIRQLISSIPPHITLHTRNPEKTVALGGRDFGLSDRRSCGRMSYGPNAL